MLSFTSSLILKYPKGNLGKAAEFNVLWSVTARLEWNQVEIL